jgi:hypothetical protein
VHRLADCERVDELAADLADSPEQEVLAERIRQRFAPTKE